MMPVSFDVEQVVEQCRAAASDIDPMLAVRDVVARVIEHGDAINAALGTDVTGKPDTLWSSPTLTVQRIVWPGGSWSGVHEHRMWAVVGVYAGSEVNSFFRRVEVGVEQVGERKIQCGDVLALGADAIHAVANPTRTWTAGIHVYGGDILDAPRSAWSPDNRELPVTENRELMQAMFAVMRTMARERGRRLSDDDRYAALTALGSACDTLGRVLTPAEARDTLVGVLNRDD